MKLRTFLVSVVVFAVLALVIAATILCRYPAPRVDPKDATTITVCVHVVCASLLSGFTAGVVLSLLPPSARSGNGRGANLPRSLKP